MDATFRWALGPGPLIATAIHDGHALWPQVAERIALSEDVRLREEDPYSARWTAIASSWLVGTHSRFQCDFNRPREASVYRTQDEAWGLEVWNAPLPDELLARMRAEHDHFYATLRETCEAKVDEHGRFLLLDLHSYNHRREGPESLGADPQRNPDINVGTGSLPSGRWRRVVDAFLQALGKESVQGRALNVGENVRFRGGYLSRWVHEHYAREGCALAIEVKKIFMDEWTGVPNEAAIAETKRALEKATLRVQRAFEGEEIE